MLATDLPASTVGLAWLGQAGFALCHAGCRVLIDPYLSDHLARKYAGTEFPHERLMPPPVSAEELRELDWVLCSHRHGDHMDPGTLPVLARNNPRCRFVVPRAEVDTALALGLDAARLMPIDAGEVLCLGPAIKLYAVPAAHETLKVNAAGAHHFLGFILRLGAIALYHSGDSVVYPGLAEQLCPQRLDLALLPVNGRREHLTARGIAGNMTFAEACDLCRAAGIGTLIPHHFGLFAFNTADPAELRRAAGRLDARRLRCHLPETDRYYTLV